MNCPKCNSILPDDSEFCQFCGTKVENKAAINIPTKQIVVQGEKEPTKQENANAPVFIVSSNDNQTVHEFENSKEPHCKVCGGQIDSKTKKCVSCGKQYFKLRPSVLAVALLAVFLVASIGCNVYQYLASQDSINKISSLESTVSSQKSEISSLNSQAGNNNDKAESYDDLISALSYGNIGYASSNFQSSESVIVVKKNEQNRKFILTANWSNGGTVDTSYSPTLPTAYVSFDNDEWDTSTTMTVEPVRAGITTVTFSNDVDGRAFKVIIVVTD